MRILTVIALVLAFSGVFLALVEVNEPLRKGLLWASGVGAIVALSLLPFAVRDELRDQRRRRDDDLLESVTDLPKQESRRRRIAHIRNLRRSPYFSNKSINYSSHNRVTSANVRRPRTVGVRLTSWYLRALVFLLNSRIGKHSPVVRCIKRLTGRRWNE